MQSNYTQIELPHVREHSDLINPVRNNPPSQYYVLRRLIIGVALVFGLVTVVAISTQKPSTKEANDVGKNDVDLNAIASSASRSSSCASNECLDKYNINGIYSEVCVECEDCNAVVYQYGSGPTCIRNQQGVACKNILYDGSTPKCFDYCANAIAYVNAKPTCVTNNHGQPCTHWQYSTYGGMLTPVCTDDCPSQSAVVRTIWGKVICVTNAQGGACKNVINPLFGDPVCGDDQRAVGSGASYNPFHSPFFAFVEESSCGAGECYQEVNYNGVQSSSCVECEDCNAVVFDMYSGSQCLQNDQGAPCQNIRYDGVTPKCFDACPNAIVYENGKPTCITNPTTGQACQSVVATLSGMQCADDCPNPAAMISNGVTTTCLLNDQGQACNNVYFKLDMTPVCMDSCPSQDAVAYSLFGDVECVLNSQGGACDSIAYTLMGSLYCNN